MAGSNTHNAGDVLKGLVAGGVANMIPATATNPLDVCKVKMQAGPMHGRPYGSLFSTAARIIREEGPIRGLIMPGLMATVLRELSYSSFRFGCYQPFKRLLAGLSGNASAHGSEPFYMKLFAGLGSGMVGSFLANPTDVVKIRLQTESGLLKNGVYVTGLYKGHPPSYRNTFHAFFKIFQDEGLQGLYKGVHVTVLRASVLTATQLASYDEAKVLSKRYLGISEGMGLHAFCAVVAGLVTTTACAPSDIIKTRLLSQSINDPSGYRGITHCFVSIVKKEGVGALFRGWLPSYLRIAPHFVVALPLYEQIRLLLGLGHL
ncbi:Mitochondrial oxaloacetate carrier protein [Phlyctochytrium bullatum]|nr:Mitochondrial oxaloacetate carrier protein [Phlyctochytrium bullatum]